MGELFVNQKLIESNIRAVQPAEKIQMGMQTENGRDSMLIVKLTVDPKIPDDSLNAARAKLILASFLTVMPNQDLISLKSCKILFVKKEGSSVSNTKSIWFVCPITPDLITRVANYKDSSRITIGYISPDWNYFNYDLHIALPLKGDWFYVSEEHDTLVYYPFGSDINELPQYRTDPDRKVSYRGLQDLNPGASYQVLLLSKSNEHLTTMEKMQTDYHGPSIYAGLIINIFESEDEYLKNLYELYFNKKLLESKIHSYNYGNAVFRGLQFEHAAKNGDMVHYLSAVKRFSKVSLVLNVRYTNAKELEEINQLLSTMKID
jgi:hypothetical protein